jgi:hypothetical protein
LAGVVARILFQAVLRRRRRRIVLIDEILGALDGDKEKVRITTLRLYLPQASPFGNVNRLVFQVVMAVTQKLNLPVLDKRMAARGRVM